MQSIKGGSLQEKSILIFVFDVSLLELFIGFKMTPPLSKLMKAFKFYNENEFKKILYSSLLFSECFYVYLRKPIAAKFRPLPNLRTLLKGREIIFSKKYKE